MTRLSVVTTLFHSEGYVLELYQRLTIEAKKLAGNEYEIIFVNDGSPDQSLDKVVEIAKKDGKVTVIDLSRNFGHHQAMMSGLSYAKGNLIFLIDSDLEEMPEWLSIFSLKMENTKSDVVFGIQEKRRGNIFERVTGEFFYRLFRLLTRLNQDNNITTARLMTKRYVRALLKYQESEINIGGLWILAGFKQESIAVTKVTSSPTTYSFGKKLDLFINAVTSFSALPLVFIFYSGVLISLTALLFIFWLLFRYMFYITPPDGYVSTIASVWFFSGLIILYAGILGIYISKIFIEVKNRPNIVIRDIYRNQERANIE
jgi:putative glycosyltransferase